MKLPECPFYLFGMGNRRKLLYRSGRLLDALTGEVLRSWEAISESIQPASYRVWLRTRDHAEVAIFEDAAGVWLDDGGRRSCLTAGRVNLPQFQDHPYAPVLRAAHQEVLVNVLAGRPLPNLLVYRRPWYRDAAMMAMCLEKTGNLHLLARWVDSLREPFDRNNAGACEADNLGQALYLISLVSGRHHPLAGTILKTVPRFRRGRHVVGLTDSAERPAYQTKWLKFGLRALGLDDPYQVPEVFDAYSCLFWMDFTDAHVPGEPLGNGSKADYPYLAWAEAHFLRRPPPAPAEANRYPLSWEARASQARYEGMGIVSPEYVQRRIAAPHAWAAAEIFLYFWDLHA
jgi:hypothetical protein